MARISLAFLMMVAVMFGSAGCAADEGWQKGLQDGVAAAVTAVISTPIQNWVKTVFPVPK